MNIPYFKNLYINNILFISFIIFGKLENKKLKYTIDFFRFY